MHGIIHPAKQLRLWAVPGICLLVAAACGGGSSPPVGPTTTAPQIACPVDISMSNVAGSSQAVTYTPPIVTGGAAPVNTGCTPPSGASFPLGDTTVTCTAQDASARQATCSFKVTLKGFSIAVTRYGAYGDSLTEGENGFPSGSDYVPLIIDEPNTYPTQLQLLFNATYPGQDVVVLNRGKSGDYVAATYDKLRTLLPVDKPDAVLLLTGYNDLFNGGCRVLDPPDNPVCGQTISTVAYGVRDCIRRVREIAPAVKYTFVSTLTPPGPYLGGVNDRRIRDSAIVAANDGIKRMAASEHATLVDTFSLFTGHEAEYTEPDGLHLRPAGYQALAGSFFSSITSTVPQTPLAAGHVRLTP